MIKKFIIAALICLFPVTALAQSTFIYNPFLLASGGGDTYSCNDDTFHGAVQERFECGDNSLDDSTVLEQSTWTHNSTADVNNAYATTQLQGNYALFLPGDNVIGQATVSVPETNGDLYVSFMHNIAESGTCNTDVQRTMDLWSGSTHVASVQFEYDATCALDKVYINTGDAGDPTAEPTVNDSNSNTNFKYIKIRYNNGSGTDAEWELWYSSDGVNWNSANLNTLKTNGTDTLAVTKIIFRGDSNDHIIDDVRADTMNIDYGEAVPFFASDWTTNSPGATDELCATAGGCPDEWDALTDANSIASVNNGKFRLSPQADSHVAYVGINEQSGNVLEDFGQTEWWSEFEIEFSAVTNWQASAAGRFSRFNMETIGNQSWLALHTDASGTVDGFQVYWLDDSGAYNPCTEQAWSPSAATTYKFRQYYRRSSGAGNNDGIIDTRIVDGPKCVSLSLDDDTAGVLTGYFVGILTGIHDDTNDYTVDYDNFKFYNSKPPWWWQIEDDFSFDTVNNYKVMTNIGANDFTVSGGQAVANTNWADYWVYHKHSLGSPDQVVQGLLERNGSGYNALHIRYNPTNDTGYRVGACDLNDCSVWEFNGSSATHIRTVSYTGSKTWTDGDSHLVQASWEDSTYYVKVDWNDDGDFDDADESYGPYTRSTYSTGNYAGFMTNVSGVYDAHPIDNFKAKAIVE